MVAESPPHWSPPSREAPLEICSKMSTDVFLIFLVFRYYHSKTMPDSKFGGIPCVVNGDRAPYEPNVVKLLAQKDKCIHRDRLWASAVVVQTGMVVVEWGLGLLTVVPVVKLLRFRNNPIFRLKLADSSSIKFFHLTCWSRWLLASSSGSQVNR